MSQALNFGSSVLEFQNYFAGLPLWGFGLWVSGRIDALSGFSLPRVFFRGMGFCVLKLDLQVAFIFFNSNWISHVPSGLMPNGKTWVRSIEGFVVP